MSRPRRLALLLVALLAAFAFGLRTGSEAFPPATLLRALLAGPPGAGATDVVDPLAGPRFVVWEFRVPRLLAALLAGAALGAGGLQMQTLFRNPLAGPDVLGLTSGAGLGVALVTLGGPFAAAGRVGALGWLGELGLAAAASAGAGAVLAVVVLLSRAARDHATLLILGLMVGAFTAGAVGLLVAWSDAEQLQTYTRWTLGSFDVPRDRLVPLAALILAASVPAARAVKPLNGLLLGEEAAAALGVEVSAARRALLCSAAVLTGVVTAFCGPIAFVGVAAPHLARLALATADHRWLLPGTAVIGGLAGVLLEAAAKAVVPGAALPVNTLAGLLGAPIVLLLVLRGRRG